LLVALAFTAGCGPRQPPVQEHPNPQDSRDTASSSHELSGKIFVTGSQPHTSVTLVPAEGRSRTLVGDLQAELARLSGAEVRVRGVENGKPPAGDFMVTNYDVTGIDGEVPKLGILTDAGGYLTLLGPDTLKLTNVPDALRSRTGAKVWVVGPAKGGKLEVQSYGILREAVRRKGG
jgi:hypothetical protein